MNQQSRTLLSGRCFLYNVVMCNSIIKINFSMCTWVMQHKIAMWHKITMQHQTSCLKGDDKLSYQCENLFQHMFHKIPWQDINFWKIYVSSYEYYVTFCCFVNTTSNNSDPEGKSWHKTGVHQDHSNNDRGGSLIKYAYYKINQFLFV